MKMKSKNNSGLTLVEIIVVCAIFSIMIFGLTSTLATGRQTWFDTDVTIELQQNLRQSLERISRELQETGFDKDDNRKFDIGDAAGVNGTDILTFSVPILCENKTVILDDNGDIRSWGASLRWGCLENSCTDPDSNCGTQNYQSIRYLVNDSSQLLRQVLDGADNVVSEDVFAHRIVDFQVSGDDADLSNAHMITIRLTAQKKSVTGRSLSESTTAGVYLRNRG